MNKTLLYTFFIPLAVFLFSSCGENPTESEVNAFNNNDLDKDTFFLADKPLDTLIERYEPSNRVNWQKPARIIELMGDLKNKTVVEIGAGTGFFTFRILPLAEKTIGVDIDSRMLDYLDSVRTNYLPEEVGKKLELRHVEPDDPMLHEEEADIILIANTFVYLPEKEKYLRQLKNKLKDNGKIFIVDYKMHRIEVGPDRKEKIPQHIVEDHLINAGYRIELSDDTLLPYQYIIIASKT